MSQYYRFDGCEGFQICRAGSFDIAFKAIDKISRTARRDLDLFVMILTRRGQSSGKQLPAQLRYALEYDGTAYDACYVRWGMGVTNKGKSAEPRIWFAVCKERKVIILLTLYTHQQGVGDLNKSEVEKLIGAAHIETH